MAPNGVSSASPPALGAPPGAVWHTTQSPAAATSRPRSIAAAEYRPGSGPATGAMAGRHGQAATTSPAAAAAMPPSQA
ncbi:hypothetical protein BPJ_25230 [Bordetella pertussis]|uniref:hypothetical protein n=1 Tax=Bordetella pertussis TaxID=520 RepID=UPI000372F48B|nr:hypothetical protein [Bordetella pertussis]BCY22131.1 hypothetical protein BPJ_25230 [Bordetella pertussis]BDT08522.1 hypothetical protein BP3J_22260 [Bordetella pertussis]